MAGVTNITNQDLLADHKSTIPFEVLRKLSACVRADKKYIGLKLKDRSSYKPRFFTYIKQLGYTCIEFFNLLWESKNKIMGNQAYLTSNMLAMKEGICRSKEGFCIMAMEIPRLQSIRSTKFIIQQSRELTTQEKLELSNYIRTPANGGPPKVVVPLLAKLAMQAGCNQEELTCLCGSQKLIHRPGACMDCGEECDYRQVWVREAESLGARFDTRFPRTGGDNGCYLMAIHNLHGLAPEHRLFIKPVQGHYRKASTPSTT